MFKLILFKQGIVNVEHRATRIAKNEFDVFFMQAAADDFCASDFRYSLRCKLISTVFHKCCLFLLVVWEPLTLTVCRVLVKEEAAKDGI